MTTAHDSPPPRTVLVVDDDVHLRVFVVAALRATGLRVLDAGGFDELPALLGAYRGAIDLVLADVRMPRMNGAEVSERIVGFGWTSRVLFMSGCDHEDLVEHRIVPSDAPFLAKPFTPGDLLRRVREMLDKPE